MLPKKFEMLKGVGLPYRFYLAGLLIVILGSAIAKLVPGIAFLSRAMVAISPIVFAAGFLIWCWPWVRKAWCIPIWRVVISISHLFVLILSTALARNLVSDSLGLPAQDFDLTVGFFVLLLYVPAWAFFTSILLGLFAIVYFAFGMLSTVFNKQLDVPLKLFAHMVGAITMSVYLGMFFGLAADSAVNVRHLVRWVAFIGDFLPASEYPQINKDERIRLHENGVVSYAVIKDGDVVIGVRKLP